MHDQRSGTRNFYHVSAQYSSVPLKAVHLKCLQCLSSHHNHFAHRRLTEKLLICRNPHQQFILLPIAQFSSAATIKFIKSSFLSNLLRRGDENLKFSEACFMPCHQSYLFCSETNSRVKDLFHTILHSDHCTAFQASCSYPAHSFFSLKLSFYPISTKMTRCISIAFLTEWGILSLCLFDFYPCWACE